MGTHMVDMDRDVIADIRAACERSGRTTTDQEVQGTLLALRPDEVALVRRVSRLRIEARPLGPEALVDIARGTRPEIAAAREAGGFYAARAEAAAAAALSRQSSATTSPAPRQARQAPAPVVATSVSAAPESVVSTSATVTSTPVPVVSASTPVFSAPPSIVVPSPPLAATSAPMPAPALPMGGGSASVRVEESLPVSDPSIPDAFAGQPVFVAAARAFPEGTTTQASVAPTPTRPTEVKVRKSAPVVVDAGPRRAGVRTIAAAPPTSESDRILALFAYHRDALPVARELQLSVHDLNERVVALRLRAKVHRILTHATDIDVFHPEVVSSGPAGAGVVPAVVVRRRATVSTMTAEPVSPATDETSRNAADGHDPLDADAPMSDNRPRNEFGTRVFRRRPLQASEAELSGAGPRLRREWVATRGQSRTGAAARAVAQPADEVAAESTAPPRRGLHELFGTLGQVELERLLSTEKANPRALVARLAERFGAEGDELSEAQLRQALAHHGLRDDFDEKERTNTRFLIGFHQGARQKLANALRLSPDELDPYLARLGLTDELSRVRTDRSRQELRPGGIQKRALQILQKAAYLDDLGVLEPIDAELRGHVERLVQARRSGEVSTAEALYAELQLVGNGLAKLLKRYRLD